MPKGMEREYPSHEDLLALLLERKGSVNRTAEHLGMSEPVLRRHIVRNGLMPQVQAIRASAREVVDLAHPHVLDAFLSQVHELVRRRKRVRVEDLADALDVSPKRVRDALVSLQQRGYRVPEEKGGDVVLEKVKPDKLNLHKSLLDGERLRIGVVSDTHLSSREQALSELHLAYDVFEQEGITEVLHAGDWTCGKGIFKTQDSEILNHTFESQVDYLVEHYPRREGITTRGISGNHDVEGEFGRIGANPVLALANRRDDIEFLGDYSAWVELPGGAYIHLLHGKGGGSYAFSYQAQRLVEAYPAGRKPAILIIGHFHRKGNIEARGVEVLWPGCFEWKTPLLERLGLTPAVGFWILDLTIGPDGSLVSMKPEWLRFFEGRKLAA